jgi:hypothetical protein
LAPDCRVTDGETGAIGLQGIGTVEQDLPARVLCASQGVLSGGPRDRQRDDFSTSRGLIHSRGMNVAAHASQLLLELGIGGVSDDKEDLMPRLAQPVPIVPPTSPAPMTAIPIRVHLEMSSARANPYAGAPPAAPADRVPLRRSQLNAHRRT